MARISRPAADALLDIPVSIYGDGIGEVVPVDYMGGDERIVDAARTSYQGGTRPISNNTSLIRRLIREQHTSPFEQVEMVWGLRVPLFVAVHLLRHRTANVNAESARYSVIEDKFYIPKHDEFRLQLSADKQATGGALHSRAGLAATESVRAAGRSAYAWYTELLGLDVPREQARMVLPQNVYVRMYWKIDLHNWFHFANLRLDWHAQQETRQVVSAMVPLVKAVAPLAFTAWEEEVFDSIRLSGPERAALKDGLGLNVPRDYFLARLGEKAGQQLVDKLCRQHRTAN